MTDDHQPDLAQIEAHLQVLFGAVPSEYSDGLVEIAWGTDQVDKARLFEAGEIGEAAKFAYDINLKKQNVYTGMALRVPEAPRKKRTGKAQAYAAGFAWFDADEKAKDSSRGSRSWRSTTPAPWSPAPCPRCVSRDRSSSTAGRLRSRLSKTSTSCSPGRSGPTPSATPTG